MTSTIQTHPLSDVSATYAGLADAFLYPKDSDAIMHGAEYLAAFDPGASDKAASLHEAAYVQEAASALFEELVRYYEHFGLRRRQDSELPDHLSVEFQFMHFLCELERHAVAGSNDAVYARRAQRDFLDRHVRRLLGGLKGKIAEHQGAAAELVIFSEDFVNHHRHVLSETEAEGSH